eukprot:1484216-Karenia_brevis.AAC.1
MGRNLMELGGEAERQQWAQRRAVCYLNQVFVVHHPAQQVGLQDGVATLASIQLAAPTQQLLQASVQ